MMFRIIAYLLATSVLVSPASSAVLAHLEYECVNPSGCFHSVNMGTDAQFGIDVYPNGMPIGTYESGETVKVSMIPEDFIIDYFTSGTLEEPEPMEFYVSLLGAGGSARGMQKSAWLSGVNEVNAFNRLHAGYDVASLNGVDLGGYQITSVDFELIELQVLDSNLLSGSALKTHYRYEIMGELVPEPKTSLITLIGITLSLAWRRSLRWQHK